MHLVYILFFNLQFIVFKKLWLEPKWSSYTCKNCTLYQVPISLGVMQPWFLYFTLGTLWELSGMHHIISHLLRPISEMNAGNQCLHLTLLDLKPSRHRIMLTNKILTQTVKFLPCLHYVPVLRYSLSILVYDLKSVGALEIRFAAPI